jgi:hypothetical protein
LIFLLFRDFFMALYFLRPDFRIRIWNRRIRTFLGLPDPHPDPSKMARIRNTA